MSASAATAVAPHNLWLSQGDVFKELPYLRAGVADSVAAAQLDRGPALLVTHDCAIDKKNRRGHSTLEYLTFLPLQDVSALEAVEPSRARDLRLHAERDQPYPVLYLGQVQDVGESYVMLSQPYTLPALLLRAELRDFNAAETRGAPDRRIVPGVWDTRVGTLTERALTLLRRKWNAHWTRTLPPGE